MQRCRGWEVESGEQSDEGEAVEELDDLDVGQLIGGPTKSSIATGQVIEIVEGSEVSRDST